MNESGLEMRAPQLLDLSVKSVSSFVEARRAYDLAVKDKNAGVQAARKIIPISLKGFDAAKSSSYDLRHGDGSQLR